MLVIIPGRHQLFLFGLLLSIHVWILIDLFHRHFFLFFLPVDLICVMVLIYLVLVMIFAIRLTLIIHILCLGIIIFKLLDSFFSLLITSFKIVALHTVIVDLLDLVILMHDDVWLTPAKFSRRSFR